MTEEEEKKVPKTEEELLGAHKEELPKKAPTDIREEFLGQPDLRGKDGVSYLDEPDLLLNDPKVMRMFMSSGKITAYAYQMLSTIYLRQINQKLGTLIGLLTPDEGEEKSGRKKKKLD